MHDLILFVYGTLRRNGAAAEHMDGATWVGPATTAPAYALVEISWYPGLRATGVQSVAGDLYSVPVSLLPQLDRFEGPEYIRGQIRLSDGATASTYLLRPEHDRNYPVVPSGDWQKR
jgi:gamma-glutamylcyclotransferase (GGCT)/AIG2-like uncharacterized protein YtfP